MDEEFCVIVGEGDVLVVFHVGGGAVGVGEGVSVAECETMTRERRSGRSMFFGVVFFFPSLLFCYSWRALYTLVGPDQYLLQIDFPITSCISFFSLFFLLF